MVEHIPDPDLLMEFLARLSFAVLFVSTPERRLVYRFDHSGPPINGAHCREWTMAEFAGCVGRWFEIDRHVIANRRQGTRMIVGRPKSRPAPRFRPEPRRP